MTSSYRSVSSPMFWGVTNPKEGYSSLIEAPRGESPRVCSRGMEPILLCYNWADSASLFRVEVSHGCWSRQARARRDPGEQRAQGGETLRIPGQAHGAGFLPRCVHRCLHERVVHLPGRHGKV